MINVHYLDIKDSLASPASTFVAIESTDSGNNTNWLFATTINGSSSITATATLSEIFGQNTWNDVPVGTNTWNDIG